ncbi:hypothetical protein HYR99_41745 [Candidatus Poribacteria bacterium]|nr:hypothetical protein [Candidatus Poribacteria bacterium]
MHVTRLGPEILLIPIEGHPTSGRGVGAAERPFRKTVRIENLDPRAVSYTVSVIGGDFSTGEERRVMTQTVKVRDNSGDSYSPFVDKMEVSSGKGYVDVTIGGNVRTTGNFISEVHVTRLGPEILLIPIEGHPTSGRGVGAAERPFRKTVRIEDLDPRYSSYTISVIGRDFSTGEERRVMTQTVKMREDSEDFSSPFVDKMKVSPVKGAFDVTIYGKVRSPGDFISDVQVTRLGSWILLIPIAHHVTQAAAGKEAPFQKTVRIADLDPYPLYSISVVGRDVSGAKRLITQTVEVK